VRLVYALDLFPLEMHEHASTEMELYTRVCMKMTGKCLSKLVNISVAVTLKRTQMYRIRSWGRTIMVEWAKCLHLETSSATTVIIFANR